MADIVANMGDIKIKINYGKSKNTFELEPEVDAVRKKINSKIIRSGSMLLSDFYDEDISIHSKGIKLTTFIDVIARFVGAEGADIIKGPNPEKGPILKSKDGSKIY